MTDPIKPPEPGITPLPPPAEPPKEPPKTFTQEDVNRIIQERLTREQARFADYDDLKAKAQELKQIKDAELSATQRLQQELDAVKAEKAGWDAEKAARELEIEEELLKAEIKSQSPHFNIPWDVAYHLGDFETEGDRDKNVKRGLEKLVKDRPDLVMLAQPPGRSPANVPGKRPPESDEVKVDAAAEKYGTKIPPKK